MGETVTATILFTDLVGSTALAVGLGPERADEVRRTHFRLLRRAIGASGGIEVKNLGDGVMVVFTSARRAVECAVQMQQTIDQHNRRSTDDRLLVRIGVSAGECTEEEHDYFGEPVVEAARLCASADGGQILLSGLVHKMVERHSDIPLVPLGDRELKGLADPVAVVEARWVSEADDPGAELPPRLVAVAKNATFGFFGRDTEIGHLRDAYKRASEGQAHVVFIAGEPGIGKTQLAARFAREVREDAAWVMFGECSEALRVPYGPWIQAIGGYVDQAAPADVESHLAASGDALAQLLPRRRREMGTRLSPGDNPEDERFLMLHAVGDFLADVSARRTLAIVLDDLHWADAASIELLRHLFASALTTRLLLIGTYRDTEVARSQPFGHLLADLRRHSRVTHIRLSGLGDAETVELMQSAAGHELDEAAIGFAHALHRETNGHPYFTSELLRHLAESGAISQNDEGVWTARADWQDLGVPASVRDVITQRADRLGADALRVLCLGAVIGREFDLRLLAAVSETDEDSLLDLLEGAIAAAVLVETDQPGRFVFAHALVKNALVDELSATRRQRAHRRIAEALEAQADSGESEHFAELARHWEAATLTVDRERVIRYARKAGDAALLALAPDDAVGWYAKALDHLGQQTAPDAIERGELLLALGHSQWQTGDADAARATFLSAFSEARSIGASRQLAEAALGYSGASYRLWWAATGTVDQHLISLLEEAIEATAGDETPMRVRLLAALARQLYFEPESWARRVALSDDAVAMARRLGDPDALVFALGGRHAALWRADNVEDRFAIADEMLALGHAFASVELEMQARAFRIVDLVDIGDFAGFGVEFTALENLTGQRRLPFYEWLVAAYRAMRVMVAGDFDRADELVHTAYALAQEAHDGEGLLLFGSQLTILRRDQGRLDETQTIVDTAIAAYPGLPVWRAAAAVVHAEQDQLEEAQAIVDGLAREQFRDIPDDFLSLLSLSLLAEACAMLSDSTRAGWLRPRLEPFRGYVVSIGSAVAILGFVDYYLGLLAFATADHATAAEELRSAVDKCDEIGARPMAARARLALARVVGVIEGPSSSTAAALLDEVESEAEALGMHQLLVFAKRLRPQTGN